MMNDRIQETAYAARGGNMDVKMSVATGPETVEESEEAYQLRQRRGGDENSKYTKKSNFRSSRYFNLFLAILAGLLIWLGLYCFTERDWIESLLIAVPKRHRRAWLPGRDWFPTDPYTLPATHYEQFKNRTEVILHCSLDSKNFSQLANVIEIYSADHNGLYWMGGTGHWFHFAERVLPMLTPAHDQVWGPDSIVPPDQRDEIYIVFAEEASAVALGAFGRFFLTSVLTGGKYKSVHICSASSVMYEGSGLNTAKGERSLVEDLKIHFTIDLAQQNINDLFIKNARSDQHSKQYTHMCAKTLLQVPLIGYRRMFHWFTDYKNITKFRDSYSKMCKVSYPPNEMYSMKGEDRREMSSWNHPTEMVEKSRGTINIVEHSGINNVNRTTEDIQMGNSSNAHNERRRLRQSRVLLTDEMSQMIGRLQGKRVDTDTADSHANASNGVKTSVSNNNGRISNDRILSDITTEEYLTKVEPGIKDDIEVVRDHGGLRKDPSVYNPFFKNITFSYVKFEIPPLHVVHKKGKQKLLIYQRDSSRKVREIDLFVENIQHQLNAKSGTIENSAEWEIDLYSHHEDGSPCELIQKLSQTSALVTAHGFQSFLLIYLPNTALVAEVFPALYYIPTYYGELQLTYRARFGLQRSYLSYESDDTSSNFIHYATKLIWGNTQWCRQHLICRHFARKQDVRISDKFTGTIASFLKYNFRK